MEYVSRERVRPLAGLLSILSLTVVFAAAGGRIPSTVVPAAPEWVLETIPHVNALISAMAIGTIALGWRWVRRGMVRHHGVAMLTSFALFVTFLSLYLYRLVATGGPQPFPGPQPVYQFVYLPVLAVHILLAIVCIPVLYYVLLLVVAYPLEELPRTNHARFGRLAASLWLISFSLGIVVYLLLHGVY